MWKRGYLWVTLGFFIISLTLHWTFAFWTGQTITETLRDTFENWQSEFLQLIWQVAGLAFLLYVGSSQSKEGDDRKEEKLDWIIRQLDPAQADALLKQLDEKYPRK